MQERGASPQAGVPPLPHAALLVDEIGSFLPLELQCIVSFAIGWFEAYIPSSPASVPSAITPMCVVQIHGERRLPSEPLINASDNPQMSSTFSVGNVSIQSGITAGLKVIASHPMIYDTSQLPYPPFLDIF